MDETFFRNSFDIESIAVNRNEDHLQTWAFSQKNGEENTETSTDSTSFGSQHKER